jgi:2-amino-4-hydroxy-6-hydroxymethyldihydropteridine diphosphokinase
MSNQPKLRQAEPDLQGTKACISLGGNIGDVAETFRSALRPLRDHPEIELRSWSGLYESEPMGKDAGPVFANAAAVLETTLAPLPLLDTLQSIEAEHDRTREVQWGPRTLDLDLILFGQEIIESPRLTVPHPHCWYRRFVVEPLAEIAPEMQHPLLDKPFKQLREWLSADEFPVIIHGTCAELNSSTELLRELESQFAGVTLTRSLDEAPATGRQIIVSFSDEPGPMPAFRVRGDLTHPRQFLKDLLNAARGNVERIGHLE